MNFKIKNWLFSNVVGKKNVWERVLMQCKHASQGIKRKRIQYEKVNFKSYFVFYAIGLYLNFLHNINMAVCGNLIINSIKFSFNSNDF